LAGIAYGPTVGNVDQNTVPERLRERGYVVVEGSYPNWIYDGPIEGMDKSQLQEARKDPENWTGGEGRVTIGDSPATSHALEITFAAVSWCTFLML
jgi:hypothetical protein